jgi:signal peptide peptidase SppA
MPAVPSHDTGVVEERWDGPAEEAKLSNDAGEATYRRMYAWRDPDKDADTKAAWKFPHHKVTDGKPGPANLNGVRNALSRVTNADIPDGDRDGVRAHLNRHLDKGRSKALGTQGGWLADVEGRVWAIRPDVLARLVELGRAGATVDAAREALEDSGALAAVDAARGPRIVAGGVARIGLQGVITPRASFLSILFGLGGGLPMFRAELRSALGDSDVTGIVIDVDSPGGLVDLVPEVAAEVRNARGSKPIVAVANTLAASAAYWIASQADEIVVTPSGEIGSIGVYAGHRDISRALDAAGITMTLISAGEFKVEGNPYEPLGDEARAAIQRGVDDYYDLFVKDVAAARGAKVAEVRNGYGQGRTLTAKRAVSEGLADRVGTIEDTIARLARSSRGGSRRATDGDTDAPGTQEGGAEANANAPETDEAEAEAGAKSTPTSPEARRLLVDLIGVADTTTSREEQ